MTQRTDLETLTREKGITIRKTPYENEYRVAYSPFTIIKNVEGVMSLSHAKELAERWASYESTWQAALDTAEAMWLPQHA